MYSIAVQGNHRVDIEISGKFDSETMKQALSELIEKSHDVRYGQMLYTIHNIEIPTLGAMGEELSRMPELVKLIGHYNDIAVLTDKKWIQVLSELEGMVIPGLSIKGFELGQTEQAEAWLRAQKSKSE
ncbi:STAS/SEC14 domain-containing protein [Motilimonas pumila]|uniref:STAS/SEC14 domain-containing protein n=1 Tax=Motilimonas pumila TaxID=2303987 RepID=A0A418YKM5_9GAMM|nr:STAS/SEC14 domain-containing protein [Motilimonas pumila]RJG51532.1 STAS/SEC14 domain-containing protein [Motilimonas pumila]